MQAIFEFLFQNSAVLETITIIIGIVTFTVGYFLNLRRVRRTRAVEYITQVSISEPMVNQSQKMYDLLIKFKGQYPTLDELSEEEQTTLWLNCSFYEFLGLSMLQGLINRKVVLLSRFALMEQIWDMFEPIIKTRRENLDRPFLYGSFEKSVKSYGGLYRHYQAMNYREQLQRINRP